ncbi:MAG: hypothetical protein KR126chlam3_01454 [Chlamydiae bacterium]|nr:hypothetical protein [Chlamydiota bacterium]
MLGKIWILFGPGSLLGALALLLYRAGYLIGHPVWLCGLILSIFLACGIIYLSFKEVLSHEKDFLHQNSQNQKESEDLRAILEEAHTLYREKVEKLEQTIATIEKEQKLHIEAKEKTLIDLQGSYEETKEESNTYKNQTHQFQISLEDALDQLRDSQQFQYIQQEVGKALPKNLPSQHRQLREQFDEKALILEQTRRRLFVIEGQLLALKKEQVTEKLAENSEEENIFQMVQVLIEENDLLEEEIAHLETLVAESLKSKREKKPKKKIDQMLEFQFEPTNSQ